MKPSDRTFLDSFFKKLNFPSEYNSKKKWYRTNYKLGNMEVWVFIQEITTDKKMPPGLRFTVANINYTPPTSQSEKLKLYLEILEFNALAKMFRVAHIEPNSEFRVIMDYPYRDIRRPQELEYCIASVAIGSFLLREVLAKYSKKTSQKVAKRKKK